MKHFQYLRAAALDGAARAAGASDPSSRLRGRAESWNRMRGHLLERRRSPRHPVHLLEVFLSDIHLGSGFQNAQVTDISTGGLGLWRFEPLAVGEVVNVGLPNARGAQEWDTIYWLQVKVVHRRRDQLGWAMGCQFLRPPSAEVLGLMDQLIEE